MLSRAKGVMIPATFPFLAVLSIVLSIDCVWARLISVSEWEVVAIKASTNSKLESGTKY